MKTVLIIGARGSLGSKVLDAVLAKKKYDVKALIRTGSDATKVEELGAKVIRGDMMDPESLETAFEGVDVVINTANGYMQGQYEVDTVGAQNVADAVKKKGVKRYIYCSILTCEKTKDASHFYDKYLAEEYLKENGISFISLRPGGFIDQTPDYLGDALKRGSSFTICPWNKTVEIGMIFTPDLASYFADAIELPDTANGPIEVGLSRPISYNEMVKIVSEKVGNEMTVYSLPKFIRTGFIYSFGFFTKAGADMMHMFNYFDTGSYVNDPAIHKKYFGEPPTPEDALGRYVDSLNLQKPAEAS